MNRRRHLLFQLSCSVVFLSQVQLNIRVEQNTHGIDQSIISEGEVVTGEVITRWRCLTSPVLS